MKILSNSSYNDMQDQIKQGEQITREFANYRRRHEFESKTIKENNDKLIKQNVKLLQDLTNQKLKLKKVIDELEITKRKFKKVTGQKGGLTKEKNKLKQENKKLKEQNENYRLDILKNHPKLTVKEYEQGTKRIRSK